MKLHCRHCGEPVEPCPWANPPLRRSLLHVNIDLHAAIGDCEGYVHVPPNLPHVPRDSSEVLQHVCIDCNTIAEPEPLAVKVMEALA